MTTLIDLLKALGPFAWPLFAFVALFKFEGELKALLARLRKGKLLGQEIELEQSLNELDKSARAAESAAGALPAPPEPNEASRDESDIESQVLREAAQAPKIALMLLSSRLEREVRELLASMGVMPRGNVQSFRELVRSLHERGSLPHSLAGAVDHFSTVRNQIVHGHAGKDDDVIRAIDSGLTILRAIHAIPHETNIVHAPSVDIYSDAEGRDLRTNVKGLVLETTSPGGAQKNLRVFPTTRTHFEKGRRVAWEWNSDVVVEESWFRHPDTGNLEYAWGQSMEFVGRHLEDV